MKKRILLCLSLLCLLGLMLALASCGHEHVYGSKYGYDDNNHWQTCIAADGEGCEVTGGTQKHALVEDSRKDPTCDKAGELVQKCKCGYKKTSVLDPLGHDVEEEIIAPTCTKEGYTQLTCKISGCRYSEKTNITAPSHAVVEKVVPPTCSSEGYTELTCENCDYKEKVNVLPASHAYADRAVEPTCTEKGYTNVICLLCGDIKEKKDEVEELGHDFVEEVIAPTCTEKGYTALTCSREGCEYTETKNETDLLPHTYEKEIIAPTCTEGGYTTNVCKVCGDTNGKSDETAPLDHDYIRVDMPANCFIGGKTTVTCSRCDYEAVENEVDPLGHIYNKGEDAKEGTDYIVNVRPTCTEEGVVTYRCTRCKFIPDDETGSLPPLGHTEEEKIIPPTCEDDGETRIVCTVCLAKVSVVEGSIVEKLGHDYKMDLGEDEVEGVHFEITKKPTCVAKGTKAYVCQRAECGEIADAEKNPEAIVDVDEIGHNWQAIVEPWCGNGGKREFICLNVVDSIACTETKAEDGELLEYRHSYPGDGIALVEPTCVAPGIYVCSKENNGSVCRAEFTAYEGDKIGQPTGNHVYDVYIKTVAPTCTEKGYDVYGCSKGDCGTTEQSNYTDVYSHIISSVSEEGVAICSTCGKSFVDITVEDVKFEGDVICLGCGKTPCVCGVAGGGSGHGKPDAPISITANEACTVTGVELASGWRDLAIGYGLIILNSEAEAEYVVLVYAEDGAEPVEFTVSGSGMVVVDLYEVSTAVKVVITSSVDATASFYKPF